MIQRALISVSDKTGIVEFAQELIHLGISILSTGGTAKLLQQHHIPVTEVADHTQFPEILDGRVKTLHPKIHGGLLARGAQDADVLRAHQIDPISLLVVNLYPFQKTIAKPNCALEDAIENIDIGGPAMLRGAAKNYAHTTVVVDPADYEKILNELKSSGNTSETTRFELARKVFAHTAQYDGAIANYLGMSSTAHFPADYTIQFHKKQDLRYGENPHQKAAFYVEGTPSSGTVSHAEQLQGKELSYNNIADADAALECVKSFPLEQNVCVIVKHANPCGIAIANTQLEAYQKAYEADPTSAFGGIIAFNTPLNADTAQAIIQQQFVEIIIAPEITPDALSVTAQKSNVRVLRCGVWSKQSAASLHYERINQGLLIQENDHITLDPAPLKVVTTRQPTTQELQDLEFAWIVAKFVKSNAIVYAKDQRTIGIGPGQTSRVMSAKIAALKAEEVKFSVQGSVMASDAFFPFRDGIDTAAKAGITAIIQPGGSMRDEEVIAAANEHGMAMVFTSIRHFRH